MYRYVYRGYVYRGYVYRGYVYRGYGYRGYVYRYRSGVGRSPLTSRGSKDQWLVMLT